MRKPVQSNAEEGCLPCRSEAVFARNAANVARKNRLVGTNVVGRLRRGPARSKLSQQLGIEHTEIFCFYWLHCIFCQVGEGSREKERK